MKKGIFAHLVILFTLSTFTQGSMSLTFQAEVEETEWRLTPSIFECVFAQPIPNYGEAVFYHEAGEDLQCGREMHLRHHLPMLGRVARHRYSWCIGRAGVVDH